MNTFFEQWPLPKTHGFAVCELSNDKQNSLYIFSRRVVGRKNCILKERKFFFGRVEQQSNLYHRSHAQQGERHIPQKTTNQ